MWWRAFFFLLFSYSAAQAQLAGPGMPGNVAGNLTVGGVANIGPPSVTWSGSSFGQALLTNNAGSGTSVGGTSAVSGYYTPLGVWLNFTDQLNASSSLGSTVLGINDVVQASHSGIASGLSVELDVVNSADNNEKFAISGRTDWNTASGSFTGTNIYGGNFNASVGSGATPVQTVSSAEFSIQTRVAPTNRWGIFSLLYSGTNAQGTTSDSDFTSYSQQAQSSTSGWLIGLGFGTPGQYFPIATTGTIIAAVKGTSDGSLTVGSLIDFSAISTVSNYDITMPNFSVTGAGVLNLLSAAPNAPANASDIISVKAASNATLSLSINNTDTTTGDTAVAAAIYLGANANSTASSIVLNGPHNTAGNGVNQVTWTTASGVALYFAPAGSTVFSMSSGTVTFNAGLKYGSSSQFVAASNCGSLTNSTGCITVKDYNNNTIYIPVYGTL